jgi:MoxR-like ATPase
VRINLNGQSDTGELIGRFVPATESRATGGAQWAWQDGVLLEALRHGWWVILDELNLAEHAILERLNSLLERTPSLLITEHDNRVFGPGGEPIHPEFRIFGTMNPAEYAGRNALSPAYRDRWRGHLFVRPAGESEYRAMLRQMVYGERPRACVDSVIYAEPGTVEPTHGELAGQPGMEEFIDALARFQASLDAACRRGKDGEQALSNRKDRPVFTRRGLIALLDHLASSAHAGRGLDADQLRQEALQRYFLARFSCEEELTVVRQLLQASGLALVGGLA